MDNGENFPAKISAHWHKRTTFMVKFDESVIARDNILGDKISQEEKRQDNYYVIEINFDFREVQYANSICFTYRTDLFS